MADPFRPGDFVRLTTDTGRQVDATVGLASPNGRSITLEFDAMVGGWLGFLAAFLHDDGQWRALDGMPLTLTRVSEAPASYTCPRCSAVSYNPNDVRERYCGRCHQFEDPTRP